MKKRILCLLICAAALMAFAAMAAFAEEPAKPGMTYYEDKTVFYYQNAQATAVSVNLYATLDATESLGTYPMTAGENGLWTVTVSGDLQQKYYTYVYTTDAEPVEIPDPGNTAEGAARSYIKRVDRYSLWVADVQVTSENAQDILGSADSGAKVVYDAATNTLTLAAGAKITTDFTGIIYGGDGTLTIHLAGNASVSGKTGAIEVASAAGNEIMITATDTAVLTAASETANCVSVGIGSKLTVGSNAILKATAKGAEKSGIVLSDDAALNILDGGRVVAKGGTADLTAAATAEAIPLDYFASGKLKLSNRKFAGYAIDAAGEKYTCAGGILGGTGLTIIETTRSKTFWLTDSTSGVGDGYVAFVTDGQTCQLMLCDVKINSTNGAGIYVGDMDVQLLLRGANTVMGSTVIPESEKKENTKTEDTKTDETEDVPEVVVDTTPGIEADSITLSGIHSMLTTNAVSAPNGFVIKECIVEIVGKCPIFETGMPDLSQYGGEYTAVAGADMKTAEQFTTEPAEPYLYFKITPVNGHVLGEWNEEVATTCMAAGTRGYHVCTTCQKNVDANGVEVICIALPADEEAHNYSYVTNKGVHTKTCKINKAHVVTENCSGGTATCTQKAVCSQCKKAYGQPLYHNFKGEFTEKNELGHWRLCTRCGVADEAKAHTGGEISCTEPYYCTICKHEYGETAGHSYTIASDQLVSEATCRSPAMYLAKCERCDSIHETLTLPAGDPLPHIYGSEWVSGHEGHWHVCACGARAYEEEHVEIILNQKTTTEKEDGYTGDIHCEVCGYEIVKGAVVPALGKSTADAPNWVVILSVAMLAGSGLGLVIFVIIGIISKKKAAK